jgi:hypothetical protein
VTVHIQGMGVIGSLLAHVLREERIRFTWSDTEQQHTAWQACTGSVYPTGEPWEYENFLRWTEGDFLADSEAVQRNVEQSQWCYNGKNAPHQGATVGVSTKAEVGPLIISNAQTMQFNMQAIVKETRTQFAKRRTDGYSGDGTLIVTHGSAQADRYVWGWSVLCRLDFDPELAEVLAELDYRPTFYMRQVYDMSYLYPYPGRDDLWYGGTSTVNQTTPRSLDVQAHYKRWKDKVAERSGGLVEVAGGLKSSLVEGWRPKASGDLPLAKQIIGGRQILLRPMGGNGVRFFPKMADAVLELVS